MMELSLVGLEGSSTVPPHLLLQHRVQTPAERLYLIFEGCSLLQIIITILVLQNREMSLRLAIATTSKSLGCSVEADMVWSIVFATVWTISSMRSRKCLSICDDCSRSGVMLMWKTCFEKFGHLLDLIIRI